MKRRDLTALQGQAWAVLPGLMPTVAALLRGGLEATSTRELRAQFGGRKLAAAAAPSRAAGIAVVPVTGLMLHRASYFGCSSEQLARLVRQLAGDPEIGTIVLDVNCPGGTVAGTQELFDELLAARASTKLVAVANATMASAAYWIAAACHEIVATPSAEAVGSIGVFDVHTDLTGMEKQIGIKTTLIGAGKYKTEGNPFEPLSDEARAARQAGVDAAYELFVKSVAKGRGVSPADVRNGYGEGRAVGAKAALALGLVDRIDTLDATLARLAGRRRQGGASAELEHEPLHAAAAEASSELAAEASSGADVAGADVAAVDASAEHELDLRRRRLRLRRSA
jgi:signal peptide peptidase SppA